MKRANKHNRLSCLISTSIHVIRCCLVTIKICGYVVYKFVNCLVWFVTSLLCVCHKFVTSLHSQTQPTNKPPETKLDLVLLVG